MVSKGLKFFLIVLIAAGFIVSLDLALEPQIAISELDSVKLLVPSSPQSSSKPILSYGHFPYKENDPTRLKPVGQFIRNNNARRETLDLEAAEAFQQMSIAAKQSNISLMPISGFRSIQVQTGLWLRQIQRKGSKTAAARWSAPPGYSEHHTGYAIDLADQKRPDTDLQISFEQTRAYQWLVANARQYGFELSFPLNNKQGIGFEPWHWRYVESERAEQIFAAAHQQLKS